MNASALSEKKPPLALKELIHNPFADQNSQETSLDKSKLI